MVKDYNIDPCTIITCNPKKGYLYDRFIKNATADRTFIQVLYTDNPFIDQKKYAEGILATGNKVQIERLLYGNRDYDETPGRLYEYDDILDMWTNPINNGEGYITVDVARQGEDKTVIIVWDGLEEKDMIVYDTSTNDVIEDRVRLLCQHHSINMSHVIVDED